MKQFKCLSNIESKTRETARNVLVAGTREQEAIYNNNGGIFTNALVNGLSGGADMNNDGIIEWLELAMYVRNMTVTEARRLGETQEPDYNKYNRFGSGEILFVLPKRL